jgi:hypothetical protein
MHGPINVKSPNNTSKWQMGFNSAFKELNPYFTLKYKLNLAVLYIYIYMFIFIKFGVDVNKNVLKH